MKISEKELKDPHKLELFLAKNLPLMKIADDDIQYALREACQLGHLTKSVQILLDNGANPNIIPGKTSSLTSGYNRHSAARCSCFNTPLQLCIINDDCKTAEVLLSRNANPNLINDNLTDERKGKSENLDLDDDKYQSCNYPPIHLATRHGHATMVNLLLRWGAEQSALAHTGEFPIHVAAREGHAHLIELFCSLDKRWVNWKTQPPKVCSRQILGCSGESALHIASKYGHVDCISLLLNHLKADYHIKDDKNNTALHSLVDVKPVVGASNFLKDSENRFAIATLLVRCSEFDINATNSDKMTALDLAAKNNYSKISQLLNDLGAKSFDANNNYDSRSVAVEVCSNDDGDEPNLKDNDSNDIKRREEKRHPNGFTDNNLIANLPPTISPAATSTDITSNVTNTLPMVSTTAQNIPTPSTTFTEKKPDIEPQKFFFPNLDNEISSFHLSNKNTSDRYYVSFDQHKPSNNNSSLNAKENTDKHKKYENKENIPTTDSKSQSIQSNKKSDPVLMKKVTSKDISITKTTIFTSTMDDNLANPKHLHSPVFDPNTTILTIKCPRSSSPLSFLSEGGRSRGLKLKVFGEVPKAYSKKQKDSARTDFIMADPIGIESAEDLGGQTRLSIYSLPEFYFRDDLLQRSAERREEWSKPLKPVIALTDKKSAQVHTNKGTKEKNLPTCDPNFDSGGVRVEGKLIGFAAKPYKSFGKISTKTDALEEAINDNSDEEEDDEHSFEKYDDKYLVREWLSDGNKNKRNNCPLELGEEFSSPEEKLILRPKPFGTVTGDDNERLSSSSVKIDDIHFRIIKMPDIDNNIDADQLKNVNKADVIKENPLPPKIHETAHKEKRPTGTNIITSTVVSSFQPGIQTVSVTKLADDENEGDAADPGTGLDTSSTTIKPSKSLEFTEEKMNPDILTTGDNNRISNQQSSKNILKKNKESKKKTKEFKRDGVTEKESNVDNKFNAKNDSKLNDIKKNDDVNVHILEKKTRKSKIPVYKPQISSDKMSDKQLDNKKILTDKPNDTKLKDDDSFSNAKYNEKQDNVNLREKSKLNDSEGIITNLRENNFPNKTLDVFINVPDSNRNLKNNDKVTDDLKSKENFKDPEDNLNFETDDKLQNDTFKNELPTIPNTQEQRPYSKGHAHDVPCVRIKKKSRPKIEGNFVNPVQNQLTEDPNANWAHKVIFTMLNSNFWKDDSEKNEYQKEIHNLDNQIDKFIDDNSADTKKNVENLDTDKTAEKKEDNRTNINDLDRTFEKDDTSVTPINDIQNNITTKKKAKKKIRKATSADDPKVQMEVPTVVDAKNNDKNDDTNVVTGSDEKEKGDQSSAHVLNRTFDKDDDNRIREKSLENIDINNNENIDTAANLIKHKNKLKKSKSQESPNNIPDLVNDNNINLQDDGQQKNVHIPKKKKGKNKQSVLSNEHQTLDLDKNEVAPLDTDNHPEFIAKDKNSIPSETIDDKNESVFEGDTNNLDVLIPAHSSNKKESNHDELNNQARRDHLIHSIEYSDKKDDDDLNQVVDVQSTDNEVNKNQDFHTANKGIKKVRRQKSKKKSLSETKNDDSVKTTVTKVREDEEGPKPLPVDLSKFNNERNKTPNSTNVIKEENNKLGPVHLAEGGTKGTTPSKDATKGDDDENKNKYYSPKNDKSDDEVVKQLDRSRETNVDELSADENVDDEDKSKLISLNINIPTVDDETNEADEGNVCFPSPPHDMLINKERKTKDDLKKKKKVPLDESKQDDNGKYISRDGKQNEDATSNTSPPSLNKGGISDEPTNRGSSDSENNSSDPDASNYLEYHVDMDPRYSGKFRIRKAKHIYDEDNDDEKEMVEETNKTSNREHFDFDKNRLQNVSGNVDTNGSEDVNKNKSNDVRRKLGKKNNIKISPDSLQLTETTTTIVVEEETVKETKKKKKKKIKENLGKTTKDADDLEHLSKLNDESGALNSNNISAKDDAIKTVKTDSISIDDKERDGYTSDDINIIDNLGDNEIKISDGVPTIDEESKVKKKTKFKKKTKTLKEEQENFFKPEIDDQDPHQQGTRGGKKSFEIFSDKPVDKNLMIEDQNEERLKVNNEEINIGESKNKKKDDLLITMDENKNNSLGTKIEKNNVNTLVDDTLNYKHNEIDNPPKNGKQYDVDKKVGKKKSKETSIDDVNDQDLSSELSTTESAMNSYELTKKSIKTSKKKLNSLTTDDSGIHTNVSLEMVSVGENNKNKKRKSSKMIKEEGKDLTVNDAYKKDTFKKMAEKDNEINKMDEKVDDNINIAQEDSNTEIEIKTFKTEDNLDDKNKINSSSKKHQRKNIANNFDNGIKPVISNEIEDLKITYPSVKKKKKEGNRKLSEEIDDDLTEEVTTTITTKEEWLEQQRRLKNKNKMDPSKEIKNLKPKVHDKQTFETNFDAEDPFNLLNHKSDKEAIENHDSDTDEEIITEILSPGSKPPLKRNIQPLIHPARDSQGTQRHSLNASDPELSRPTTNDYIYEGKFKREIQENDNRKDENMINKQRGHVPRQYSAHSKSYEENINTTTTVVETVTTDRWKRRSRRRPKSVSFESISRRKPLIQDRPLTVKAPDKTLEQAAFEMLQINQAEKWRKNWKTNPVVYTRGVYRPQQPLYKRDGGVDGNVSFKHDESRISQAFPPWSEIGQGRESSDHAEIFALSDGPRDESSPQHNTEDGTRYNEHVEEYAGDDDNHENPYGDGDEFNSSPNAKNIPPGAYGKGFSPIFFNSISRKVTYLKPIKRRRGYNSLSLYPIRGVTNQSSKDLAPRVSEPVPSDLNKYGYLSKLWMEQVDRKTLQKCETMYLSVLPKGMKPPDSIEDSLFERYINNRYKPNDPKSLDVDGSQWVIARGRSVRQAKRKWVEQKEKLIGDFGNASFADVTGNVSPTRSMTNRSFAGNVTAQDHPTAMLFFKIGQINWPDLAWVLFDGIQSDAETVRTIADVRLKNPDDCGAQVRDLMARWWTKKGDAATIDELQTALEFVQIPFIQEEDQQANFFFPAKDDHFEEEEYSGKSDDKASHRRNTLLLKEVPENDPDVSRMLYEYEHKSPNVSFAALADQSQQIHLTANKSASGNLLQVPSFRASKQIQKQEEEDHSFVNTSFSTLKDKVFHPSRNKSTSKQNSLSMNAPDSLTNLGSSSSFRVFSSNILGGKNKKSKNDSLVDAMLVDEEKAEKPFQKPYLAKNVDLESNL